MPISLPFEALCVKVTVTATSPNPVMPLPPVTLAVSSAGHTWSLPASPDTSHVAPRTPHSWFSFWNSQSPLLLLPTLPYPRALVNLQTWGWCLLCTPGRLAKFPGYKCCVLRMLTVPTSLPSAVHLFAQLPLIPPCMLLKHLQPNSPEFLASPPIAAPPSSLPAH